MSIRKIDDNNYLITEELTYDDLKKRFKQGSTESISYDGDFVKYFINRFKDKGCIILTVESEDKTSNENYENTSFLHSRLFYQGKSWKRKYETQEINAVYIYEDGEIYDQKLYVIPFYNVESYTLNDLKDFALKVISGGFNDKKHNLKTDSFVIIHPEFNSGQFACINQKGEIVDEFNGIKYSKDGDIVDENKKRCFFYYKEIFIKFGSKTKWQYLDLTEEEKKMAKEDIFSVSKNQ